MNRNTKALFSWIGFRKKEITFKRRARVGGKTKYGWGKMINHAIDGITSFTVAPLRLAMILGFIVSFGAFIYIIFIIAKTLAHGPDTSGYPSTMSVILFLGGIQLLSIGAIGEYIGRIFTETKQRPLYIIEEMHHGKTTKPKE
jgi:glycosyltransferase involved in cell wall biosynthesis